MSSPFVSDPAIAEEVNRRWESQIHSSELARIVERLSHPNKFDVPPEMIHDVKKSGKFRDIFDKHGNPSNTKYNFKSNTEYKLKLPFYKKILKKLGVINPKLKIILGRKNLKRLLPWLK